jgi:hypothetical protein
VIAAVALLSVAVFTEAMLRLRTFDAARHAVAITTDTASAMRNPSLDDRARERLARQSAGRLAAETGLLLVRTMAAAAAALVPVCAAQLLDLARAADVARSLASWPVVIAATLLAGLIYLARMRPWLTN